MNYFRYNSNSIFKINNKYAFLKILISKKPLYLGGDPSETGEDLPSSV